MTKKDVPPGEPTVLADFSILIAAITGQVCPHEAKI